MQGSAKVKIEDKPIIWDVTPTSIIQGEDEEVEKMAIPNLAKITI